MGAQDVNLDDPFSFLFYSLSSPRLPSLSAVHLPSLYPIVVWKRSMVSDYLMRSMRVSAVVTFRASPSRGTSWAPATPGWMEVTKMIPKITARIVVVM